jgi:hypothetical protein
MWQPVQSSCGLLCARFYDLLAPTALGFTSAESVVLDAQLFCTVLAPVGLDEWPV